MTDTAATTPVAGPGVAEPDHNAAAMDVLAMVKEDPKIALRDAKVRKQLYERLDKDIDTFAGSVDTPKGRDEVRKKAMDITRLKTLLDNTGKDLTEDFRKATNEVNEIRREIKAEMEPRVDKMRAPLTAWEDAEKAREEKVRDFRKYLEDSRKIPAGVTVEKIAARRAKIMETTITEDVFGDLVEKVTEERDEALSALDAATRAAEQAAADAAELEKLRQEKIERDRKDDEERRAKAREEEARIERETAERERQEAVERARQEEADKVRREAEEKAAREQREREAAEAEIRRKAQEAIDAANERARQAEAAAAEARQRALDEEAERERQAEITAQRIREDEEQAQARRRDEAHRATVILEIETDLVTNGASNSAAKRIAQALLAGSIRHVTVEF